MEHLAAMVTPGSILADVGTDHSYIPIELVQRGCILSAIAMDLREGPLERARAHIAEAGLERQIQTRLSDGVAALGTNEADSILIAGMGGELVMHILSEGRECCHACRELILQPQSQIGEVRRYLRQNDYEIVDEDMVYEDGKYYPMMRVIPSQGSHLALPKELTVEELYGPVLLKKKSPVLLDFLKKQYANSDKILKEIEGQPMSQKLEVRLRQLRDEQEKNLRAQQMLEERHYAAIRDYRDTGE
jgi:tRNA (adenine22-N1)-methyltransferase